MPHGPCVRCALRRLGGDKRAPKIAADEVDALNKKDLDTLAAEEAKTKEAATEAARAKAAAKAKAQAAAQGSADPKAKAAHAAWRCASHGWAGSAGP